MKLETYFTIAYILVGLMVVATVAWLIYHSKRERTIFDKYTINSDHDAIKLLHDKNVPAEDKRQISLFLELKDKINSDSENK